VARSFRRWVFSHCSETPFTIVCEALMKAGYARLSKADGFQTLDLQMDALSAAGVGADHIRRWLAHSALAMVLCPSPAQAASICKRTYRRGEQPMMRLNAVLKAFSDS